MQWRTWVGLLVGIAVGDLRGGDRCFAAGRDGVSDEDPSGPDEDVFDEQAQDALLLGDGGGAGIAAEPVEEVFEVGGEFEVGVAVDELGGQGVELVTKAGFAGAEFGHAVAQLVQRDQLLLVGLDQPGDGGAGLGQCLLEALLLGGGGVGGTQLIEAPVHLGADQRRIREQVADVVPHDLVEVVGARRFVVADPAVLVAVVVWPR
jgi:hypothetical protein